MSAIEAISGRPAGQSRSLRSFLNTVLRHLSRWQQAYRTRLYLLELSDHELEDLGLSRAAARAEAARPFWDTDVHPEGRS